MCSKSILHSRRKAFAVGPLSCLCPRGHALLLLQAVKGVRGCVPRPCSSGTSHAADHTVTTASVEGGHEGREKSFPPGRT